jgi:TP901 family phage tail tape measure protein
MARSMDLVARLIADTKQFQKGMRDAELSAKKGAQNIRSVGRSAENLGGQLSKFVTLPILAVGAAAVKMSTDFESTFSKMQGLAGVAADEVEGLKSSVLGLAGEVGKSPQELAEALYFIRSAGIDGSAALETLEYAAKGAAAGLGSTVDVADAVTSALNAYGEANLSAARATDVLVESARQGKAEPAEMAKQFGRLLPVSSELGISFDQVGAGMAFLSRTGAGAEGSATGLLNVMTKLLKPSKQAIEALDGVGLTLEDVQKNISEDGLLGTLTALRERLGDSGFNTFFEDQQAVIGALALTANGGKDAQAVFDALADSAGATDEAFKAWAETAGFKNSQAFAKMQAALIELGDVIVPVLTELVEKLGALAGWFADLPGPVKQATVAFAALAATVGPLLLIGGKLAGAWVAVGPALTKAAVAMRLFVAQVHTGTVAAATLSRVMLGLKLAGAFVAAGLVINKFNSEMEEARSQAQKWVDNFAGGFDPATASASELEAQLVRLTGAAEDWQEAGLNAVNPMLKESAMEARDALIAEIGPLQELKDKTLELAAAQGISTSQAYEAIRAGDDLAITASTVVTEIEGTAVAFETATEAAEAYTNALKAQFDPFFGLLDAVQQNKDAQAELNELYKSGTATADEIAAKQRGVADSALDVHGAATLLNAAIKDQPALLDMARETLESWIEKGTVSEGTAAALAEQLGIAAFSAGGLGDQLGEVPTLTTARVTAPGLDGALAAAWNLSAALNSLRDVTINVAGSIFSWGGERANGGPVMAGRSYLVGENGPEVVSMSRSGYVTPNHALGGSVGGSSTIVVQIGDRVLDEIVVDSLDRASSRNGAVRVRTRAS